MSMLMRPVTSMSVESIMSISVRSAMGLLHVEHAGYMQLSRGRRKGRKGRIIKKGTLGHMLWV